MTLKYVSWWCYSDTSDHGEYSQKVVFLCPRRGVLLCQAVTDLSPMSNTFYDTYTIEGQNVISQNISSKPNTQQIKPMENIWPNANILNNVICSILFTTKHGLKKWNTVVDDPNKYQMKKYPIHMHIIYQMAAWQTQAHNKCIVTNPNQEMLSWLNHFGAASHIPIYIEVTHWPYIVRCTIIWGIFIWDYLLHIKTSGYWPSLHQKSIPKSHSWETHTIPDSDVDDLRLDAPLRRRNWSTYFVGTLMHELLFLRIKQNIPNQRVS